MRMASGQPEREQAQLEAVVEELGPARGFPPLLSLTIPVLILTLLVFDLSEVMIRRRVVFACGFVSRFG